MTSSGSNVNPSTVGFEDGNWYKFRSVGDNNVIGLDTLGGTKLICMTENSDLDEVQLFRAIRLLNGKYRIVSKCQKSPDATQVWDYLSHRELLILKKQSPTDRFTQNWTSEHVTGYNSLHLIQSGQSADTQKCLKNMGPGKQIQLIKKTNECIGDTFTRWYLELQGNVAKNTASMVQIPIAPTVPVPQSVELLAVPEPELVPMEIGVVPIFPVPVPVPMEVDTTSIPSPIDLGFKDGHWYKFRSVGDNNVIQVSSMEGNHKLTCMPESKDLDDVQRFQVTLLSNGKFSITSKCREMPGAGGSYIWDYLPQGELSVLILTSGSETDKFSQNWASVGIPAQKSEYLIQPNPSPDSPESDSHKCLKNMGQGNLLQLINQCDESVLDSYVRWILELQNDDKDNGRNIMDSPIPLELPLPIPIVAATPSVIPKVNDVSQ